MALPAPACVTEPQSSPTHRNGFRWEGPVLAASAMQARKRKEPCISGICRIHPFFPSEKKWLEGGPQISVFMALSHALGSLGESVPAPLPLQRQRQLSCY